MGLIDFLCVFVSFAHKKEDERRKRKAGERNTGHQGSSSGTATKLRGVSAVVLCLEPIHLHRLRYIRENTCTALNCIVFSLQRSPACLPECSNIWQRRKRSQKEHLHSSKQPSLQTVLMKVVTVPEYKAALLIQHLLSTIFKYWHRFLPGLLGNISTALKTADVCVADRTHWCRDML